MPSDKTTDLPPSNWLRRQCPRCGLWVTGIVEDGAAVGQHPCGKSTAPPMPRAVVPTVHFRLKGGKLQQLMDHPSGGRWRWWIDVPTVPEDAADVIPG